MRANGYRWHSGPRLCRRLAQASSLVGLECMIGYRGFFISLYVRNAMRTLRSEALLWYLERSQSPVQING